ncbi:ATP11-domain-containing protein [Cystobasidium minutum MCA 4210]|uniref:ATP11-domain-containing protein n=1 Tax=Cystobasidium minutum MCA 4210 TaxID=1397322 RepID=UPI0034CF5507|eukprot:jgi/Rhomi1/168221/fgenesh1_kg.2_\
MSASRAAVLPNHALSFARAGPSVATASSRHSISNTPKWSDESLSAVRDKYEAKYAERLKQKAKEQGFEDIEQLKRETLEKAKLTNRAKDILSRPKSQRNALNAKLAAAAQANRQETTSSDAVPKESPDAQADTATPSGTAPSSPASRAKSPIKPLSDIVDMAKLIEQPAETVAKIWNGFHLMQGPESRTLSAVIPYEIYSKMEQIGRKYPQFVVPLPREVADENNAKREGAEMHFMQWSFLPGDPENPSVPAVSTVLFTPLALFKSQQTFAQPHLILTHYSDLVPSHGIVLMRGDLSENVATTPADAQLLVLRLQQFYQDNHETRAKLLRTFHEDQAQFDVNELIKSVGQL